MPSSRSRTTHPEHLLITTPVAIRWRDLDAFNHVNNAVYLTYLEQARLEWLQQVPGTWFHEHAMPVLSQSTLNYRLPLTWPADIRVELHADKVGRTSLTIGHRIVANTSADTVHCDGKVVMTWMDPATGKSVALPDAIREAVKA